MKKALFALTALALIFTGCDIMPETLYQVEPPPNILVTAAEMPSDTKWLGATCEIAELEENGEDISTIKANRVFRSRSELDDFIAGIKKNGETKKVLNQLKYYDGNFFTCNALYYSTECECAGMLHEFQGAAFAWDEKDSPSVEVYMKKDSSMCCDSSSEFCYFVKLAQSEIQDIPDEKFSVVTYIGDRPVSAEKNVVTDDSDKSIDVTAYVVNSHDYFENDIDDANKIFRSYEELSAFINDTIKPNYANGVPARFTAYDESFFKDKVLFYTTAVSGTGSVKYFTEKASAEKCIDADGKASISIVIPTETPDICTEDMTYFCIFAEIDKKDAIDVPNDGFSLNNIQNTAANDDEDLDDFVAGLAYVDDEINKTVITDEYKSGDAESRAALLIPVMERLKSDGRIKYYIYSKDSSSSMISFEYSVGGLGGVMLEEFPADKN